MCLASSCAVDANLAMSYAWQVRQRGWSRSRTLSVSYMGGGTTSPLEQRGSTTVLPEELMLDYAEITSIPPLPLWTLLAADKEIAGAAKQNIDDHQVRLGLA